MRPDRREEIGSRVISGGLCLMLVGVPLAYSSGIYEYSLLPKDLILQIAVGLIGVGWVCRTGPGRPVSLVHGPVHTALLCFVVIAAVASCQTTHPLDTTVELLNLLTYVVLFLVSSSCVRLDDLKAVLAANSLALAAVSVVGILQYHDLAFTHIPSNGHPSSTFGYRNFAAMYLVCAIPLAVLHAVSASRFGGMAISSLGASLGAIFLVYTRTRGAWAGILGASLIVLVAILTVPSLSAAFRGALHNRRRLAVAGACLALFICLAPLSAGFTGTGRQRFDEKKADIASTVASAFDPQADRGRRQMWLNTKDMIFGHPILGVGLGGWKRVYPAYDRGAMIRDRSTPRRPHNDYLWIASETGLPGLAAYLCFLATGLVALVRLARGSDQRWSLAAPAFAVAILATLGHALFSFPRERPQAQMFLFLLVGIAAGSLGADRVRRLSARLSALVMLLAVSIPSAAGYLTWQRISFDRHFVSALLAEEKGNWIGVLSEIQTALSYGHFRPHGLVIQGRALDEKQDHAGARKAYQRSLDLAPYSWHALNGLGVEAKHEGDLVGAEDYYRRALAIFPASISVRSNLGALYRSRGETAKAEELYRSVLGSRPEHVGALNNLGNILKSRGALDSAAAMYERALLGEPDMPQAHYNLADIFRKRGDLTRAVDHYTRAARLMPAEARVHWALGLALEALKDTAGAEAAYRRATSGHKAMPEAFFNLGEILFAQERYGEALESYRTFVAAWKGDRAHADFAKGRIAACEKEQRRRERNRAP